MIANKSTVKKYNNFLFLAQLLVSISIPYIFISSFIIASAIVTYHILLMLYIFLSTIFLKVIFLVFLILFSQLGRLGGIFYKMIEIIM